MVAGDFNCHTTNTRIIPDITIQAPNRLTCRGPNPDCTNMVSIHNISNTNAVSEGITDGFWIDPFRSLYPNRRDFTYSTFNKNASTDPELIFFLCPPI